MVSVGGGRDVFMAEERKVQKAMVNKTPIRLVAIDEEPLAEDDESATPIRSTPEHEAITRRVPSSGKMAPPKAAPERPRRVRNWRRFIPAGVALAPVLVVLATKVASRLAPAPVSEIAASAFSLGQAPQAARPPVPTPIAASQNEATRGFIHVQITAEPVEAEVSLDGNVLAGHRLNLEVPKDRGIHVVSVAAPGYFPFNQQVSFSDDIVLHINLRRVHAPAVRQVARPRPSHVEARPQSISRSSSVQRAPGLEPGMDLDGPAKRNGAKPIDERNPYRP